MEEFSEEEVELIDSEDFEFWQEDQKGEEEEDEVFMEYEADEEYEPKKLDLCAQYVTSSIKEETPASLRREPSFFAEYERSSKKPDETEIPAEERPASHVSYVTLEDEEGETYEEDQIDEITLREMMERERKRKEEEYKEKGMIGCIKPLWKTTQRRMQELQPAKKSIITYYNKDDKCDDRQRDPYSNYLKKMIGGFLLRGVTNINLDKEGHPFTFY